MLKQNFQALKKKNKALNINNKHADKYQEENQNLTCLEVEI